MRVLGDFTVLGGFTVVFESQRDFTHEMALAGSDEILTPVTAMPGEPPKTCEPGGHAPLAGDRGDRVEGLGFGFPA